MPAKTATAFSTPAKTSPAPAQDSPGTWLHPRLQEITYRREKTSFTDKNVKAIAFSILAYVVLYFLNETTSRYIPLPSRRTDSSTGQLMFVARLCVVALPAANICFNLAPLFRKKDDCSDIPLTPGQRKLLGLPPASAPPTPGSVYSTPPRYSRTPSIGSAGSRRSISSSPISTGSPSNIGSPGGGSGLGLLGSPGSPLMKKAMDGARRSSLGSLGSPSPRASTSGASLFGGVPDSPSPNPATGKRSSVGLNKKWLYERGRARRSSGNSLLYS